MQHLGDIVFVVYPGMKKAEYRLGKVVKLMPDRNGNVRTLEAALRPRDKRTDGKIPLYSQGFRKDGVTGPDDSLDPALERV